MSTSGTQSPPLEATGEQTILGVSSIDGNKPEVVSDSQQRHDYMKEPKKTQGTGSQAKSQIMSEERPHQS
ncbi:hypothetical protein PUNSTDRAFT_134664 [Punctularia strigosozonata HHB-11173 SS5]|uniref:uncharacterized protein n=1 Tax=Punctularia strigosozonata (strain HHB-11173) TaxID=741275 RepID=UPI0004417938|nr:uncharacterized protein PUNSTDRAFT_134664 [Punctularia strigosozonata HHB-11173 SS5]EIN08272.1 hypothetical protein PUNSTDRAFT_134664 [Punctularia strigosozonata HHB-11173 SS5]